MRVEWGPAKARSNLIRHGISFSDAEPAFYDDFALSMPDTDSELEQRFVLVGSDALGRVLTIAYTYRSESIRLISARKATKTERKMYEKGLRL